MKTAIVVIVIVVVVGLGAWYFLSQDKGLYSNSNTTTNTVSGNTNGVQTTFDKQMSINEYAFSPNTVTVGLGETVRLLVKNNGSTDHNFIVDELGVSSGSIAPGKEKVVTINGSKVGTFKFYCGIDSHRGLGLEGTVTVTAQ